MAIVYNYMTAIGEGYPNTQCHCFGDGSIYEDIVYDQGDPIPAKSALDDWISAKVKVEMWKLIQAERDRRTNGGLRLPNGYWFHSDPASRIQYIALMMLGAGLPQGIMWKTMTGAFVQMSSSLVQQIFGGLIQSDQIIFAHAESLKVQMYASSNPSEFDYTVGWTTIYGD